MNDDGATPGTYNTPITLNIVAAGNGWWVNTGPNPSEIATYIFVDSEEHPELGSVLHGSCDFPPLSQHGPDLMSPRSRSVQAPVASARVP